MDASPALVASTSVLGDVPATPDVSTSDTAFESFQLAGFWPAMLTKVIDEYMEEEDSAEGGKRVRERLEAGILSAGSHVVLGSEVWRVYHEFEKGEMEDEEEGKELEAATARRKKLYMRQLSMPLVGNEDILQQCITELELSEAETAPFLAAYRQGAKQLEERLPFEKAIAVAGEAKDFGATITAFKAYVDFEVNAKQPSRAQALLERALSEGCSKQAEVWVAYSDFCLQSLGSASQDLAVLRRAVRSVKYSVELWCRLFRALERNTKGVDAAGTIKPLVMELMQGEGLKTKAQRVEVMLAYLSCFRRGVLREAGNPAGSVSRVIAAVRAAREAFKEAEGWLHDMQAEKQQLCLLEAWVAFEDETVEELGIDALSSEARELWEAALKRLGKHLPVWQAYVAWERSTGRELDSCRQRLRNAVVSGGKALPREELCTELLQFELAAGSLEQYDTAVKQVGAYRKKHPVKEKKHGKQGKGGKLPAEKGEQKKTKKRSREELRAAPEGGIGESESASHGPAKKVRSQAHAEVTDGGDGAEGGTLGEEHAAFITNLPFSASEEEVKRLFPTAASVKVLVNKSGRPRGMALVIFGSAGEVEAAVTASDILVEGRALKVSVATPEAIQKARQRTEHKASGDHKAQLHKSTVFVKGLSTGVGEAELTEMFQPCGAVLEVRFLKDRRMGKKKDQALVQMLEESSMEAALKLDGTQLKGQAVSVEQSKFPAVVKGGAAQRKGPGRLLPRALRASALPAEEANKPKSQDDFRKMMLG